MTPDREPVLDPVDTAQDAAAVAVGPVPAPRPEVLARVLEGLRDLPAARRPVRGTADGSGGDTALPFPRRRS
ncbi:hypothetical protein Acsp06_30360 [Actinomycetospora sp. NBRC 106375]|uniref:hypothetical protein n=1 Tax=Actinomycetospora sp. NBRC 106375 TaxID=3032207 RepID=UPI0024A4FEBF|nr:hypothetical protein [Actinomycetospora sp. NBRC 106375]GLZ46851.1 hypothetical protein Acsp06_30360 [Actinomycetospora sp. NBRC 106375]